MNWINHVLFTAWKIKFFINPINSFMMQVKDIRMKELSPMFQFYIPSLNMTFWKRFTGKHLCLSLFLNKVANLGLQLY